MFSMLIAYDAAGQIVGTLAYAAKLDAEGRTVGYFDFEAHELAGGSLTEIWRIDAAVGSGTWPEWLGSRAHDFRVELDPGFGPGRHRIRALVHKTSGLRRERNAIATEITTRMAAVPRNERGRSPVDLTDLLGGPGRPLRLDDDGRTLPPVTLGSPDLPSLPIEGET